jgi:copper(I)-binding protein
MRRIGTGTPLYKWLACAALLGLTGSASIAAVLTADVQAAQPWIRWLPANVPSAGYVTLINRGSEPHTLTSVASPDFGAASLHATRVHAGMSAMTPVHSILIAAHGSVQLAPGGYHIMLEQPLHPMHVGDQVPITLGFADGTSLQVSFEVRAGNVASSGPDDDSSAMPGPMH